MKQVQTKNTLLGVSGGIAAYKAAELVRRLVARGATVRVVMTSAATQFITPLTFQALSGNPVSIDLLDEDAEAAMGHIELARWAEQVLIAPASANFLAKLSAGLADDLLSTLCLATGASISVAPAMNQQMWQAAATQANIEVLRSRGVNILGPDIGSQACGDMGPGRMLEPLALANALLGFRQDLPLSAGRLVGKKVLITAGPTREAIDPVRFISNHSSGKMGYELARVAAEQGAYVTLISGPSTLSSPSGVRCFRVERATDMHAAVMARASGADIFIAAAAVADYAPASPSSQKLKKRANELTLSLVKNPDILADVAALHNGPFTVGFAAETNDIGVHALAKLRHKSLDMIAANEVGGTETGFNVDTNALQIFWEGGSTKLPYAPKTTIAKGLIDIICDRLYAQHSA